MEANVPRTPRVTVLITLYNKAAFVEDAVRSILVNSFTDIEVLVVDDASTDGGPELVRALNDPRVRVLTTSHNTGRAAAANRGFGAARGEYIAVLDADDRAAPDRLAEQVAFMDAHPEVGACGSWLQAFGESTSLLRYPPSDARARCRSLFGTPIPYGGSMLRRSVLEGHGLRCDPGWTHQGMDYLFLVRIGFHARFENIQRALTHYRRGSQNMRHGRDAQADAQVLYREIFRIHQWPISAEQLRLHLFLTGKEFFQPSKDEVRALFHWKEELLATNARTKFFPEAEFTAEVNRRWDLRFYSLAASSTASALMHLRCSRKWPWGHITHMAKSALVRWRQGKPRDTAAKAS